MGQQEGMKMDEDTRVRQRSLLREICQDINETAVRPWPVEAHVHTGPENYKDAMARLMAMENGQRWCLGDTVSYAKRLYGVMAAYRLTAEAMGCSERWAFELAKVSEAFPWEHRYVGVSWNLYRACAQTEDPVGMLERAIEGDMEAADVRRAVGRPHAKDLVEVNRG